ncbi:glycosyltransferase family 1 protein [Streptococcus sp. sy010]|nr:glycosyltransferase family 1 protein [Streptococcus sp. sy010]
MKEINIMRKNVLMIVPTFNYAGGIESFVMNTLRFMNHEVFQIDIMTHELTAHDYVKEVEKYGGQVYQLPRFSPRNVSQIKEMYESILQAKNYDVVHCNMANAAFLYLGIAKRYRIPVRILHSHQNKAADKLSHAIRNVPLLYIGKKWLTHRIACSKIAGDYLFGKAPYDLVYNAIDYNLYQFDPSVRREVRTELGFSESDVILGHTGRLTPQKNQSFLIQLLSDLRQKSLDKSYHLVLVGEGEDKESLLNLAATLQVSEFVHFLGERNDIPRLLQAFDLFVFPSLYEGVGISVLEAQAAGLYSICSSGVPEEADISPSIVHLDLNDKQAWLTAIDQVYHRTATPPVLDEKYDIRQNAERLSNLYHSYLS